MAFLSLLDDRAKPKGSRDPLGFELVWTHYGRQVIGNLTTVTSSLNNFAVALVGFKWANELCVHLPDLERQAKIRETFLRYEQLTGYLRFLAGNTALMGITRISKRMQDQSIKISLGLHADETILSDQASYGMWGLYSSAMRDSGLIRGDERILSSLGKDIAQRIETRLDKDYLLSLLTSSAKLDRVHLQMHAKPFLRAIQSKPIQSSLVEALMGGSEKNPVQQELWLLTREMRVKDRFESEVSAFIEKIRASTQNQELKYRLIEIENIERLLVATNNLFHYCRRRDGKPLEEILHALNEANYNYSHLSRALPFEKLPHSRLLDGIRASLITGNNLQALEHILQLNKRVMEERGGAPWVELEPGEKLRVRVPSETSELCSQAQLLTNWDYKYFFNSYLSIANQAPVY